MEERDVIIIGAGHNGLVAATFLARAGLDVLVLERSDVIGGAVRTEYPFARAPGLGASTGAYLLGLMPPELVVKLGVDIPYKRRDPHYFLPTTGSRYLLFGADAAATRDQLQSFFSAADWAADQRLQAELDVFRDDIGQTWLQAPLSIEETAERYVRPSLRSVFVDLCRGSIGAYLDRFGFESDLLKAMYAVTDGFSGCFGAWDTPGTGMNFLVHNMCRLPTCDGTWMVVEGGMGTITTRIAALAREAGATIRTGSPVRRVVVERGAVVGVETATGMVSSTVVVSNADPFTMSDMVERADLGEAWFDKLDRWRRPGTTFKLNLALSDLPTFTCLPEDRGQHRATMHLLPDEDVVLATMQEAFEAVGRGELPEFPTIEWYVHTTVDATLRDDAGNHNSALFVQWVPQEIEGSSWAAEESRYAEHLLSICDRFAPGTSDLVVDTFPLNPQSIEARFGMRHGHIHHVDNTFGFSDRAPYSTPLDGLYSASAGTHPAGAVIGAAGHNAAMRVLADMGLG